MFAVPAIASAQYNVVLVGQSLMHQRFHAVIDAGTMRYVVVLGWPQQGAQQAADAPKGACYRVNRVVASF